MPNEEEPQPRPGETLLEFAERLRSMAKAIERRARKRTIRSDYYFMKASIVESQYLLEEHYRQLGEPLNEYMD